ncbi:hypothetical protein [Streptomyces sp. NPDC007905]|uniref:hypothetical protein n=1 Tax=Streptomyces sp. NPDC007905 TaxID=3364788 RepID=UPI0036E3C519
MPRPQSPCRTARPTSVRSATKPGRPRVVIWSRLPGRHRALGRAAALDGIESGAHEVLGDDTTRWVKSVLSQDLTSLYQQLAK